MSLVVFKNKGVIDTRAIRTFGVSAKVNTNPIGFFGTGLKYAISILMRNNIEVKLFAGGIKYDFARKEVGMRGKDFEVVTMNDDELPFSTNLGINWQLWQAFRELYCNALDENGKVVLLTGYDELADIMEDDSTYFVVNDPRFTTEYHDRNKIVLDMPESHKLYDGKIQIFNAPSKFIYYRGVRVMSTAKPMKYTYNMIEDTELTEDRTVKSESGFLGNIALHVGSLQNQKVLEDILVSDLSYGESDFNFHLMNYIDSHITPEFFEVLERHYKKNNDKLNITARHYHQKRMAKNASKHYEPHTMTKVQEKQLKRALDILYRVWPDAEEYKVMVVTTLGQETMALADATDQTMVISAKCFDNGTKYLLSTLIEEYKHLRTGFNDLTRALQTHLFDQICTLIENNVINEPI